LRESVCNVDGGVFYAPLVWFWGRGDGAWAEGGSGAGILFKTGVSDEGRILVVRSDKMISMCAGWTSDMEHIRFIQESVVIETSALT
jgi:hypothetical protein